MSEKNGTNNEFEELNSDSYMRIYIVGKPFTDSAEKHDLVLRRRKDNVDFIKRFWEVIENG